MAGEELRDRFAFFGGEVCVFCHAGKLMQQKPDPTKTSRTVAAAVSQGRPKGEVLLGIYELEGNTLSSGAVTPTRFRT